MATLKYDRWEKDGDLLILHGESIGNRQTISFADTMRIEKVSQDSLILRKGQRVTRYAKADVIPAEKLVPAKKAMTVKGELVIGHEVRSFKAEGDTAACWVVDKSGDLIKKYDEVTGGTKNGTPVYVEMEGGVFAYSAGHLPVVKTEGGYLLNPLSADTIYKYSHEGICEPYIARTPGLASMDDPVYLQAGVETSDYIFLNTGMRSMGAGTVAVVPPL